MKSRAGRAETVGMAALALLGTVGGSVFGILAGQGGTGHLRNSILAAVCATILVLVTLINRFIASHLVRTAINARERAVENRERFVLGREGAGRQASEARITAEGRVAMTLRARLSPVLYCLGKIAAASSGPPEAAFIGSLRQAIVSAAAERPDPDEARRSVLFAVVGDQMECVSYSGHGGKQDAARTVFRNSHDDPVGRYMFQLLGGRETLLIRDVDAADLPIEFPSHRSYRTIIIAAVMAGESPYGILTLDAPQADSLGQPDVEIMSTLASLLEVGLTLGAHSDRRRVQVPAQGNRE